MNLIDTQAGEPQAITSVAEAKDWLAALPLTNVGFAHTALLRAVQQLAPLQIPALERLKILEHLRAAIYELQTEIIARVATKPLPHAKSELEAVHNARQLWEALSRNYQKCLQAQIDADETMQSHAAFVVQRCVRTLTAEMLSYYSFYEPVRPGLWLQLHTLYHYAESQQFADKNVKESRNPATSAETVKSAYVRALLIALADPYHFSARQLFELDGWLDKWSLRVNISMNAGKDDSGIPVAIDLKADRGATVAFERPDVDSRYLSLDRVGRSVRKRIKFLRDGGDPAEIGLRKDPAKGEYEQFLAYIYAQWCESKPGRACDRHAASSTVDICFGAAAAYFYINGEQPFAPPDRKSQVSDAALRDIQIFGHVSQRSLKRAQEEAGFELEAWRGVNESALGFCVRREIDQGGRIHHRQLLALRPPDTEQFVLGSIQWTKVNGDLLELGLELLAGVPRPVAARQAGIGGSAHGKYVEAFKLPEVSATKSPPRLILPAGWFRAARIVHLMDDDEKESVKLSELVERGADYEIVLYTPL